MYFNKNENLKEFLWKKTTTKNQTQNIKTVNKKRYPRPCFPKTGNLWFKQVKQTNKFSSFVIKKTYNVFNKLNNKSSYLIYLMEFVFCKRHYTAFNLRLNNTERMYIKSACLKQSNASDYLILISTYTLCLL